MSCMGQTDTSLVEKSGISGDVLIINQCDVEAVHQEDKEGQRIRMISTRERGLSRSRNMAIAHSEGDICLLCDDDEVLFRDYEQNILRYYQEIPDADIIAFDLENKQTRLKPEVSRVGRLGCLKLCSCQLTFRRKRILEKEVSFCPYMGSGSGNGCSEENKFLLDCIAAGLRVYYVPVKIARLETQSSEWFFGFDETFFYQRGGATRFMLGLLPSVAYGVYYLIAKRSLYQNTISMKNAAVALARGIRDNNITHQKNRMENG